jgi:diguanylate cyclase (GGDEF)-like protein
MNLSDFPLESIGLPAALVKWSAGGAVLLNSAFRELMGDHLSADQALTFEDLDTLLGGQLQDFNPQSKDSITQEIKIGRKRFSYVFTAGTMTDEKKSAVLLLGVDKSDALKAEAKLTSYVGIIEENNRELRRLANTDPLTATANRRALFNRFQQLTQQMPDFHCTVSILDIDHFKRYNDEYGHDFGDSVLKTFAEQVRVQLADKAIFARIGGEEFCVVDYSGSSDVATGKLQGALDVVRDLQLATPKTETVNITFSAGVAEYGKDGETLDDLLKNADRALYYAKANGRSCVIPYSADLFEKRDTTLIARVDNSKVRE